MAKSSTRTRRPAKTPKEVLQPKVAPAAAPAKDAEQLQAAANAWDAARQALKDAGEAAALAQKAFDELPAEATDEQRHEAQLALDEAEKTVKGAEARISDLANIQEAAGTAAPGDKLRGKQGAVIIEEAAPPSNAGAEAAAANAPAATSTNTPESEKTRGAGDGAGPAAAAAPARVNLLQLDGHPLAGAFSELIDELEKLPAHPRQTRLVVALGYLRQEAEDLINGIEHKSDAAKGGEPAPAGSIPVRVAGPKKGRWRAGHRFTPEPVDIHVTADELAAIEADPTLSSERLD